MSADEKLVERLRDMANDQRRFGPDYLERARRDMDRAAAKIAALTAEIATLRKELENVEQAARNLAAMLRQLRRWAPDEWAHKATNLLKRYGLQGSVFRAALRQEGKP